MYVAKWNYSQMITPASKTHYKAINFARKQRAPDAAKLRRLF
jgi:hypothetical protein